MSLYRQGDTTPVYNGQVTYSLTKTGGPNYAWDFGDSSSGAGLVVSHTYQTNGNYQVTLTADPLTDPLGTLSAFRQILVTSVNTLIHHYFENLNVTMGNSAT